MSFRSKSPIGYVICLVGLLASLGTSAPSQGDQAKRVWTDPTAARSQDPDFSVQGEYGSVKPGAVTGVQVVALGQGRFDVYVLQDGLPGLGWTRDKERIRLQGTREGESVRCSAPDTPVSAVIRSGTCQLVDQQGHRHTLSRVERRSPTLGAKPPRGAQVLFDGGAADLWENGKTAEGYLLATGCTSKPRFKSYTLHLEFRTPYMPDARGQGRGNSGVYHGGRWETQVLDSFGLEGKDNECGGIYSIARPRLNMCLPPLAWQTYDVHFQAATFDVDGKRSAWPRITVKLNGVLVHNDLELPKNFTTAAPLKGELEGPEGPVYIQDHRNPVVFRNIWVTTP